MTAPPDDKEAYLRSALSVIQDKQARPAGLQRSLTQIDKSISAVSSSCAACASDANI